MSPRGILCAHTMLRVVVLVRLPLLAGPLVAMCVRAQSVCGRGLADGIASCLITVMLCLTIPVHVHCTFAWLHDVQRTVLLVTLKRSQNNVTALLHVAVLSL